MDVVKTGLIIAQARKERGLTQRDLAQALHVSIQAVSKWERGLNFPDIALLEPLAGLLDLPVSDLLAGERGRQPQEVLVRETLGVALSQFGRKLKKWRGLFGAALAALAVLALLGGYRLIGARTDWLPQRETVVTPLDLNFAQRAAAEPVGKSVAFFDLTTADGTQDFLCQLELWTQDGLAQTWELAHAYVDEGEAFPRHMSLAFGWNTGVSAEVPVLRCSLSGTENRGVSWTGPVAEVPRIGRDFMVSTLAQATAAEPELGVVAVCFSLDPSGRGLWQNSDCLGILSAPSVEAGKAFLLLRMTFT